MADKPQFTVIEAEHKLLMTPPEFAKFTGRPVREIRQKCMQGFYPHEVKYSKNCKPFIKVLVPETLAIIKKECLKNAPLMAREQSNKNQPTAMAARVISKALSIG